MEAAEWLAERGSGYLVLVGRSEAGAEVRQRLAGLEAATGSRVVTAQADVADAGELAGSSRDSLESARGVRSGRRWRG